MGLRYNLKQAEIWRFGLFRLIHAHSAPWTRPNLSFALLKPCGLASRFEYNKPYIQEYIFPADRGRGRLFFVNLWGVPKSQIIKERKNPVKTWSKAQIPEGSYFFVEK
jgi:hypothetical protein